MKASIPKERTTVVRQEVQVEKVLACPPADLTLSMALMRSMEETRMIMTLARNMNLTKGCKSYFVSCCCMQTSRGAGYHRS